MNPGHDTSRVSSLPLLGAGRTSRYDAIVIGSGIGGCVTAALVANAGLRVLVLEKNPAPGGITSSIRRQRFKLDLGSHLVSRGARGPLGRVLRSLKLKQPRFLTHPIPVRSRGMFNITAPATRAGLPHVALEAARILGLSSHEEAHLARMVFQLFTLTEHELRQWDRRTLEEFVLSHTENPKAYFLISFLASIFFVVPPWEASAGESLRCLRRLLLDYNLSYIQGGMDALVESLLQVVIAQGGDVAVSSRVVRASPDAEQWKVETREGETYSAPALACNVAPADLFSLVDERLFPAEYPARLREVRGSGNAHQLKLALRRPLVTEGCLIGGISLSGLTLNDLSLDLMRKTVATIDRGEISDPLAVYAPIPTNYDASLAPEGGQIILASVYGSTRDQPLFQAEQWKERALRALNTVIPGLLDELIFAEMVPISGIGMWMGKSSRAAICNAQIPGQVGRDRLPVATPLRGLFLCGDGAGGRGIGTELAATSAMQAAGGILTLRAES